MIHLPGILLVVAGSAVADRGWITVEKLTTPFKKLISATKASSVKPNVDTDHTEIKKPKAHSTHGSELQEHTMPLTVVSGSEENLYHLALSTGTMGIALAAQFGITMLTPLALFFTGYIAAHIFRKALHALFKEKHIRVDILDAIVISLCLLFGQIGVAAFMVWILDLVDLLLEKTTQKSRQYLTEIFGEQARYTWLLVDDQEIQFPIKDLREDDIIVVSTGEQVPIDGVIVAGEAMIDQQVLTGEATAVEKRQGDKVFAMTILVAGKIRVKVQETGKETLAAKIIQIVNEASDYKVELQSVGEKIADKMVLPTLGLGTLGYVVTGPNALLAIINSDYGTGIRVAAPIALLASLGVAAKHGVLIKDGKVFELLKDIDVVLFDKTGTLTHEIPVVSEVIAANHIHDPDKVLLYAAAAEQKFSHPIANALLKKAKQQKMVLPEQDESHYHVGLGIEVLIHGDLVKVGSSRYMELESIPIPMTIQSGLQQARARGQTAILVAVNNQIAGMIELQSQIREEASGVIAYLKQKGKHIALISGDHDAPTRELAHQLGVDRYFAGVLPHEKADYVKALHKEGKKVMMVGDGINDAPALAQAHVGIAIGTGTDIAMETADVTLIRGDLRAVVQAITLSKATMRIIKQNLFWAFGYNVLLVPIAMGILYPLTSLPMMVRSLHPALAAAAMALSSVSVVMNSLRLR